MLVQGIVKDTRARINPARASRTASVWIALWIWNQWGWMPPFCVCVWGGGEGEGGSLSAVLCVSVCWVGRRGGGAGMEVTSGVSVCGDACFD